VFGDAGTKELISFLRTRMVIVVWTTAYKILHLSLHRLKYFA
jgi:hypothetical protein